MPGRRAGIPARTSRCILDPTPADSWTTPRSDRRESRLSSCRVDRCTYTLCRRNTPHYISHSQFFVCAAVFSYLLSSVTYSLFCILVSACFFIQSWPKVWKQRRKQKTEKIAMVIGFCESCWAWDRSGSGGNFHSPLISFCTPAHRSALAQRPPAPAHSILKPAPIHSKKVSIYLFTYLLT